MNCRLRSKDYANPLWLLWGMLLRCFVSSVSYAQSTSMHGNSVRGTSTVLRIV